MKAADDSIEIESATLTEAEMTAALGGTVSAPDEAVVESPATATPPTTETTTEPATAPAPTPAAATATNARSEFERKVDELDPPLPNETKEQRTVRMNRGEKRILGLLSRAKASETELESARAEIARLKAAPVTTTPSAGTPPATEPPAIPPFRFESWDQYSEQHPEASHEDYLDARGDAREAWKTNKTRIEREHAETERFTRERDSSMKAVAEDTARYVNAFRAEHPEFDDAMTSAMDLPLPPAMHAAMVAQKTFGPAIALYLAQHRDEAIRIATLAPIDQIGEIRDLANTLKAGQTPTPSGTTGATPPSPGTPETPSAPAPRATITPPAGTPSRPLSDAPAPTSTVVGSATPTPSLAQLAAADEDADAYIVARQRQRKEMGLRR